MLSKLKCIAQVGIWLVSFTGLCLCNYHFSIWVFTTCGSNLLHFAPVFLFVLSSVSFFVYIFALFYSRLYVKHLLRSLDQTDMVEFSLLMSKFKEREQCTTSALTDVNNYGQTQCLVCLEYAAKTVTQPCGHQVMCGSCAWKYIATCFRDNVTLRCILCRTEVTEYNGDITVILNRQNILELSSSIKKSNANDSRNPNVLNLQPCH